MIPGDNSDDTGMDEGPKMTTEKREVWNTKIEYMLSLFGYSVGIGNIWRFPYLCMRNGGGAFLIPFFFFLLTCGIPLYFMEVGLGQFSGKSPLVVWSISPLFKGIGYLMVIVSTLVAWYYNMIIAWVIYYFIYAFFPNIPWATCDNWWNTEKCIVSRSDGNGYNKLNFNQSQYILNNASNSSNQSFYSLPSSANSSIADGKLLSGIPTNMSLNTAAFEFWHYNALRMSDGIDNPGTIQWHLVLALVASWFLAFCCLFKGVKSIGKVVYVTVILPYILLTVLLVRGLTLDGAVDGIIFYLKPDFSRLLNFQVWIEAGLQVFYSLGPVWGGLITMSSYNKFHNQCMQDAIAGSLAVGVTCFYAGFVIFSILGFMARDAGIRIEDVAESGPSLIFIAYPEALIRLPLPHIWGVLFFLMLITIALDTQFGMLETVSSAIADGYPQYFAKKKLHITAFLCSAMCILGLPFTTQFWMDLLLMAVFNVNPLCYRMRVSFMVPHTVVSLIFVGINFFSRYIGSRIFEFGGMYLFQLVDWYCASLCVLLSSFLECIVIAWIYGAERFSRDMELMIGRPVNIVIRVCWCIFTPCVMLIAFISTMSSYQPPNSKSYTFPEFAIVIGWVFALLPVVPLPVFMFIEIYKTKGSLFQQMKSLLDPPFNWGPHNINMLQTYKMYEYGKNMCENIRVNILGDRDR